MRIYGLFYNLVVRFLNKVDSGMFMNLFGFETEEDLIGKYLGFILPSEVSIFATRKGELEVLLATASTLNFGDHDQFFAKVEKTKELGLDVFVAAGRDFNSGDDEQAKEPEESLDQRLSALGVGVIKSAPLLTLSSFAEGDYIQLVLRDKNPDRLPDNLQKLLSFIEWEAEKSLEGNDANYRLNLLHLVVGLDDYLGKELPLKSFKPVVYGHTRYSSFINLEKTDYVKALVQRTGSPFTYDDKIEEQVRKLTAELNSEEEKSRVIFDWITDNCQYGEEKRKIRTQIRGALDVYYDREGVCGELAVLQVTMERLAGNLSYKVNIDKGTEGKINGFKFQLDEHHAVAARLDRNSGKLILIDLTAGKLGYDVQYDSYRIVSDDKA